MMGSISIGTSSTQQDGLSKLYPRLIKACAASFVFRGVYSRDKGITFDNHISKTHFFPKNDCL
ncbi:hypothetical protein ES332_A01G116700v1 [Gossypium tomentosum]|uniref:Uncharacterized protein n=1 Tax=Gossypium tomentosum TaxID=34277 RepID=A0A5D2RS14_GOSTO|nr:hypothetical protein ES332_A01G116700v1 [Gossypium tomentosum]